MPELPIPWGALPYYQMHFIVLGDARPIAERLIARTRKRAKGTIRKQIVDVWWEGGDIANTLNQDKELRLLLKEVLLEEGEIRIDPTEGAVRIYGEWKHEDKVQISKKALEAYDAIAGHVRKLMTELAAPRM
ncbi:MAG: hypothetical protein QXU32_04265 [Nitrososphaerales archaeon]